MADQHDDPLDVRVAGLEKDVGVIKTDVAVMKNDMEWVKKKLESVDYRSWWILGSVVALGIVSILLSLLKQ